MAVIDNVAAGTQSSAHFVPAGTIITVTPSAGATATVMYTVQDRNAINNNVANYLTWPKGAVTSATSDLAARSMRIRVLASGGTVQLSTNTNPTTVDLAPYQADFGGTAKYFSDANGNVTGISAPGGGQLAFGGSKKSLPRTTNTFRLMGNQSTVAEPSAGSSTAYIMKLQVEAPAKRIRFFLCNKHPTMVYRGVKIAIAPTSVAAMDTVNNAYGRIKNGVMTNALVSDTDTDGFQLITWDGGNTTSGMVPPGGTPDALTLGTPTSALADQDGNNLVSIFGDAGLVGAPQYSDWCQISSLECVDKPGQYYYIVRLQRATVAGEGMNAQNTPYMTLNYNRWVSSGGTTARLFSGEFQGSSTVVDTLTMLPGSVSAVPSGEPYIGFEIDYGVPSIAHWGNGDSITEAYQWQEISVCSTSTPTRPVSHFNMGGSSTKTEMFFGNMRKDLRYHTLPDIVTIPSDSINDYTNKFNYQRAQFVLRRKLEHIALLRNLGIKIILWINFNYPTGTNDRSTPEGYLHGALRDYAAKSNGDVTIMETVNAGFIPQTIANNPAGMLDPDSTHPNVVNGIPFLAAQHQIALAKVMAQFA